ncbi:Glycosidase [Natronoarchaeum philippinense]|uniref:Glycosidase n=1 Tax=Natronoarchaeum philippinense TaxID=558529 RepID=A0A285NZZ7_NATPI|nr:alpha-amylase family glycosyl hydrolase [Natronoarchaeum philippinense]SNZ15029.1 Glycosidase [Natronoarchaeum philippinense]
MRRSTHVATLDSLVDVPIADGGRRRPDADEATVDDATPSSHPGPPQFVAVNETIEDPNGNDQEDRDALAPRNPVADATYSWSVVDAPADSEATVGDDPIVGFDPDVPGEYTLALDADDGRHELTVRVFPPENEDDPRPRVELDADVVGEQVVLTATATTPPANSQLDPDIDVELYVDDRDRDALTDAGSVLSAAEIDEPVRIHAVAAGRRYSVADSIRLVPDGDSVSVERPYDPPSWLDDAVFYEIFTRRFPDQDDPTFDQMAEHLDHLDELGVDALWLTPFVDAYSSFGTDDDMGGPHGYDALDYFSVDPELGTMADFEAFVDACHERDIKVVFDLVVNHTSIRHEFFQAASDPDHEDHERYRDWYRWEDEDELVPDTYFGWSNIPNLNYENPEVREFVLSIVDFWVDKVDGFRCDVAWGVQHSFWKEVYDRVQSVDEDFLMLDESVPYFADFSEGEFHIHHDDRLHEALGMAADGDADAVLDAVERRANVGVPSYRPFLQYAENHDLDRFLAEHGRAAQMAAGAATFTLPGNPMLYYGQETGLEGYRDPMNWGEFDEELYDFYRSLVDARKSIPALGSDAGIERVPFYSESDRVLAFSRVADDQRVVVVLNFAEGSRTVRLGSYVETTDLLTDAELSPTERDDGLIEFEVETVAVLEADEPPATGPELDAGDSDDAREFDAEDGLAAVTGDDSTES